MIDDITKLIQTAIEEDIGTGDISSQICVPKGAVCSGTFVAKSGAVVAGMPYLEELFRQIDEDVKFIPLVPEGAKVKAGTELAKVTGNTIAILSGERIALNLLQHASAVATATHEYVRRIVDLPCNILDTRKTLPGLRALEKYAVRVGGGVNYRFSLDDRFVIKTNHLYFLSAEFSNPVLEAVKRAKRKHPHLPIEIEITQPARLDQALKTEADAIMLSRMSPYSIAECVKKVRQTDKRVYVESLGTITQDTIRAYAETGVDGISIGSITHSIPALEMVLRLK
ncbi:MAG: carboxylating nicotinate-nucleotide diphosphorylase [Waddliaceae bacterium]